MVNLVVVIRLYKINIYKIKCQVTTHQTKRLHNYQLLGISSQEARLGIFVFVGTIQ